MTRRDARVFRVRVLVCLCVSSWRQHTAWEETCAQQQKLACKSARRHCRENILPRCVCVCVWSYDHLKIKKFVPGLLPVRCQSQSVSLRGQRLSSHGASFTALHVTLALLDSEEHSQSALRNRFDTSAHDCVEIENIVILAVRLISNMFRNCTRQVFTTCFTLSVFNANGLIIPKWSQK